MTDQRSYPGIASEPVAFINARLVDLAEANALYGKDQRLGAPDKIARNDREISWLKDLRSIIASRTGDVAQASGICGEETKSQAKEPKADVTDLRCGAGAMGSSRHVAGRTATTTSENLDVTAGETAPNSAQPSPAADSGWQPIETAPKDGNPVIAWDAPVMGEAYFDVGEKSWWWANTGPGDYTAEAIYPTLWRPMPAPPSTLSSTERGA